MADMTAQFAIQVLTDQAMRDVKAFGNAAVRTLNQAGTQATGKLSSGLGTLQQRLSAGQQQVDAFNAKWDNTLRLGQQVGAGMTAVGGAIALGLGKAYQAAAQFDQGMRNVNSIAKLNTEEFDKLTKSVKGIAAQGTVKDSAQVLASGLYDIYSSGLQGAQALEALEIASKGASAGMSDTATASNVLVAAMNAYDKKGPGDAAKIMDVLFKTVDRGVVTFPQLAGSMGNVMGTASQVGVSIEELGAGLATMTKQGIGVEESVTSLNAIMMAFLTPSKDMEAAIKAAGYESGLAIVKAKGLAGAVEFLTEASNGNQDTMAGMLGNVRAIRGAMALTGAGAKTFAGDLDAMKNSAGAMGAALDEQSKGAIFRQEVAFKNLGLAAIAMGDSLKGAVAAVAPALSTLIQLGTQFVATPIGQAFTIAAAGAGALMLAVGPLLYVLPNLISGWQLLNAAVGPAGFAGLAASIAKNALPWLRTAFYSTLVSIEKVIIGVRGLTAAMMAQGLSGALSTAVNGLKAFGTSLVAALSTPAGAVTASLAAITLGISLLRDMAHDARNNLKKLNDEIGITQGLGDKANVKGATPEAQQRMDLTRQIEEINKKRAEIRGILDQARVFGVMTGVGREIGGMEGIRAYEDYYKELGQQRDQLVKQRAAVGKRASGGPVLAGGMYLVGEDGPELFAPQTSGQIIPNADKNYMEQDYARGSGNAVTTGISTGLSRAGIGGLQKAFMGAAVERGYNIGASMATQPQVLPSMVTGGQRAQIGAGGTGAARGGMNVTVNVQGNIYGDAELKRRIREEVYSVVREAVFA